MKKRILTLLAILAVLVACIAFSAQAEVPEQTPFNGLTDKCPHCNTVVTDWTEFAGSISNGKHYKISKDYTMTAYASSGANKAVVWICDDVTVTAKSGNIAFRSNAEGGELWVLGGENSLLTGNGAKSTTTKTNGGLLRAIAGGTLHIGGALTCQISEPVSSGHMGGVVDVNKGNLYIEGGTLYSPVKAEGSTYTVYGAVVVSNAEGKLKITGGNILANGVKSNVISCPVAGEVVLAGNAYVEGTSGYSAVYMTKGTVILDGNATVKNASYGTTYKDCIYIKNAQLQVAQTWTGKAGVRVINSSGGDVTLNPGATSYGSYIDQVILKDNEYVLNTWDDNTSTGNAPSKAQSEETFEGELYAYSPDTDYPRLNGWRQYIMPRRFQMVSTNGTKTWETDYEYTFKNWGKDDAYAIVWATDRNITIPAGKTITIDFNGKTVNSNKNLTVNGTLYAFDSKATLDTAGVTLVTAGSGTVSPITVAPTGKTYAIAENTIYEVAVTAAINQAALRPATAGMYFGAQATVTGLDAGKAVAEANLNTGVAVATTAGAAFADTAWTATQGVTGNGILINNILKDGEDNATRADISVYAKACVTYGGKLVALGEEKSLSMTGLMQLVAAKKPNDEGAKTFYDKWANGTGLENADSAVTAWTTNELLAPLRAVAE